jgi:hypothetical protein
VPTSDNAAAEATSPVSAAAAEATNPGAAAAAEATNPDEAAVSGGAEVGESAAGKRWRWLEKALFLLILNKGLQSKGDQKL